MNRLLFLSKGDHSPSTRYRAQVYFPLLRQEGWEPLHLSLSGGIRQTFKIFRQARHSRAVIILRKGLSPLFLFTLKKLTSHLIFDFDDAIYTSPKLKKSFTRLRRFRRMVRSCHQIWAGNPHLAEKARFHSPSVEMIPTSIDFSRYSLSPQSDSQPLQLVWIGSSSTGPYLEDLLERLERVAPEAPPLELKIISDFSLHSSKISLRPCLWSPETEVRDLSSSHIGLAPLPDNEWTRGKCGLKVLQYMAAGLPVIASPVGIQKEMVIPEKTGFWATTDQEWKEALSALASPKVRRQMGRAGRQWGEEQYSRQVIFEKIKRKLLPLLPEKEI